MPIWNRYLIPHSIEEALAALTQAQPSACVIAGGTDLLLDLQQGRHPPVDLLVDLTQIPALRVLEERGDHLYIGSGVSLNVISRSPLVIEHAEALSEACSLIGGPQVRNTATLGGNVAHALPAADGTIALLACDARVDIATPQGLKQVDLAELFLGPGKSALAQDEIIAGFRIPLKKQGQACAFKRVMRMQGVALPIINMAVWVERDGETIRDIRITIGPAGKTPYRANPAEDVLRGNVVNEHSIGEAYSAVLVNAVFRSSPHRAGSEYRKAVSGALLNTLIRKAWDRTNW